MINPNQSIDKIGLSVRTANVLKKTGINTVEDLLNTSRIQLVASKTPGLGKLSIEEALKKADELRTNLDNNNLFANESEEIPAGSTDNFQYWVNSPDTQAAITAWISQNNISISELSELPARAYNILYLNGYKILQQIAFIREDELMQLPHMDKKSAQEIIKITSSYLEKNRDIILNSSPKPDANNKTVNLHQLLQYPNYREAVIKFIEINDADLLQIGIPQKICKKLQKKGLYKLSHLFSLPWEQLENLDMVSISYAEEIVKKIDTYLEINGARLIAFCNGDESVLWDDTALRKKIIDSYSESPFSGYSLPEFQEKLQFSQEIPQDKLKRIIGKLIAEGYLEYVDFRCYRIYKRFADVLECCSELDGWKKEIVQLRLAGLTLEEIGNKTIRTRESVRQTINSAVSIVKNKLISQTGSDCFDEDYYRYFYKTYDIKQADAEKWLGIPASTWYYLEMISPSHGKKKLEEAIDDYHNLDLGLRLKIKNFINNDKLYIDGVWVKKRRDTLEKYVIQHYCRDEVSAEEFIEIFNNFLTKEEVDPNEDLWLDKDNLKSRKNAISRSDYVLWSFNEQFRYYDIEGRDFTELLETINIESYENTEISTLKLMNDYPDIMRRYDIRNQYQLHNLLKKIIPDGSYNGFHCGRMPILEFGTFDRVKAISNLIISNSPLTQEELIALIYDEFGFEIGAIPWGKISKFKAGEVYRNESKIMSDENMHTLKTALPDCFYYMNEIRKIYSSLFPEGDLEEVNSYNLRSMGFMVYPDYAVQNYSTADAFFQDLLTKDDIVDLAPLRKRYSMNQSFYGKLQSLKHSLEIIEFEPNKTINIRKLLSNGISKNDLESFCDEVYDYVTDNEYFSVRSLLKSGFQSDLLDLGFSDWFYANLLAMDEKFAYNRMFSNIILYKGEAEITIKSFGRFLIQKHGSIDVFDLLNELTNDYGCMPKDRYDLLYKVQGEEIYYDNYLDRLYANEEIYFQELDNLENK